MAGETGDAPGERLRWRDAMRREEALDFVEGIGLPKMVTSGGRPRASFLAVNGAGSATMMSMQLSAGLARRRRIISKPSMPGHHRVGDQDVGTLADLQQAIWPSAGDHAVDRQFPASIVIWYICLQQLVVLGNEDGCSAVSWALGVGLRRRASSASTGGDRDPAMAAGGLPGLPGATAFHHVLDWCQRTPERRGGRDGSVPP